MLNFVFTWGFIIASAVIDVVAIIIIKARLNELGPVNLLSFKDTIAYCVNVVSTLQSFIATIFLLLTPVLYGFALSRVNLSTAYPLIIGFSAISLVLCSYLFLEESITLMKRIGVSTIVVGITLIYFE